MAIDELIKLPDLYSATNIEELHKSLSKGYNINEKNGFDETPLLSAIRQDKAVDLIEEFLKLGADVNTQDCWGITPLYSAITRRRFNLKLVKLLLENGADIKGGKPVNDRALDRVIIHNRPCAKLLIKYKFLKNYNFVKQSVRNKDSNNPRNYHREYKEVVDLNIKPSCYSTLSSFLDKCAAEVLRMQCVRLCNGQSLLKFVSDKMSFESLEAKVMKQVIDEVFKELDFHHYFVYKSMIASRIGKEYLLSKIGEQLFQMNLKAKLNQCTNKTFLNSDIMYHIAKYLCDEDLLNFAIAHVT